MPYTKELPEWNAGGIKPPQSKLDAGWQVDEKPPASWWNWYMYTAYQSLLELQQNAVHGEKLGANSGVATLGSDGKLTATQLPAIGSGQITDGTIANAELASDVKIGSLASLTTMAKASVTGALNEVKQLIDTHLSDSTRHITAQERTTWNAAQLFALTSSSGAGKSATNADLNKTVTSGFYNVLTSDTNNPTTTAGAMLVMVRGSSVIMQILHSQNNELYTRYSSDTGATWSAWQKLANTSVATTSANGLMSSADKTALDNAQKWKLTLDNGNSKAVATNDADNEKDAGFFATYTNTLNVPEVGGHLQVIKRDVNQSVQIFYGLANRNVYVRYWIQYWTPWKRLTDTNTLGSVLLGNKLIDTQTLNFINKVSGSASVNPHVAKRASGTTPFTVLTTPSNIELLEMTDAMYSQINSLDGTWYTLSYSGINGWIAQHMFSFNLIEHVQRTYGTIPGATTADKVTWLKANISKLTGIWHGYGSSPSGNKAYLSEYLADVSKWAIQENASYGASHSNSIVTKLTKNLSASRTIDFNGFVHLLAYADPSNGTTSSAINTDYIELQVELSTSLKDNMKPVWIDATLQNGWVEFDADRKPRYSIGSDGFVTLKGAVKSGTYGVATPVLTLPSGFRPLAITYSVAVAGTNTDKSITVRVNTSGQVSVIAQGTADNTLASLDGVRFPTN